MTAGNELKDAVVAGDAATVQQGMEAGTVSPRDAEDLLIGSIIASQLPIAKLLLERGVSPNAYDVDKRWPALRYAVDSCNVEITKLLLERGADPNALDNHGNNSMGIAIRKRKECPQLMRILIDAGVDLTLRNYHGVNPEEIARNFGVDLSKLE